MEESNITNNINLEQKKELPKKKPGPCCVCKPQKRLRDNCLRNFDEDRCKDFIDATIECMQSYGYWIKKD